MKHLFTTTLLLAFLGLLTPGARAQLRYYPAGSAVGGVRIDQGIARIHIGHRSGHDPIVFEAAAGDVLELENGWQVHGDLELITARGRLPLLQAELLFEKNAYGEVSRLVGRCAVPPPFVSDRVRIASPAMAQIGFDQGENIHLGVPLGRSRSYLFFHFDAGLSMEFVTGDDADSSAAITMGVPNGVDGTLILDPSDSFYFLGGAFLGSDDDEEQEQSEEEKHDDGKGSHSQGEEGGAQVTGKGRSEQGLILFEPWSRRGIEEHVAPYFQGHSVQTGIVPLDPLPLELVGTVVTRFEKNAADGFDPLGVGIAPSYRAGANGELHVAFPVAEVAGLGTLVEFGFSLGRSSAGIEVSSERQVAHLTGHVDPDLRWLPNSTPFVPEPEALVVGLLSSEVEDSCLDLWGRVAVDMEFFSRLSGIQLQPLPAVEGHMRADRNGLLLRASAEGGVFGPFEAQGEVALEARFASAENSYLQLTGNFLAADQHIEGTLTFHGQGARLEGSLRGELELSLQGELIRRTNGTVLVAEVEPPKSWSEALQGEARRGAAQVEVEVQRALVELQEATQAYEVELSLRGMRSVIPRLCDTAIASIENGIEKKVKSKWPDTPWGKPVPGRSKATKKALAEAKPSIQRLRRLKAAAGSGSDAAFQKELKAAIADVLRHKTLKVSVKPVGTVWKGNVINGSQESQLRKALAAVDALPAASERKLAAEELHAQAPADGILAQVGESVDQGLDSGMPSFESLSIELPLESDSDLAQARARIGAGDDVREVQVSFDPRSFTQVGLRLARSWVEAL